MNTEKQEKTQETTSQDDSKSVLSDQINKVVDDLVASKEQKEEKQPEEKTPVAEEVIKPEEEKEPVEDDDTELLIERAVKAGIPLKTAKKITDTESLSEMCEAFEAKSSPADSKKEAPTPKEEEKDEIESILSEFPDFEDDAEDYDPKLLSAINVLKKLVFAQNTTIKKMNSEGSARSSESWTDTKIEALGKDFAEALGVGQAKADDTQKANRASIEKKFNMLTKGYEATGEEVDKDEVFNEAVALVLGDVKTKSQSVARAEALDKRSKLHLARPTGSHQTRVGDADSETVALLEKKFKF